MQAPSTPQLPENTVEILVALTFAAVLSAAIALIAGGIVRRLVASVEGHTHTHITDPFRKAPVRLVRMGTFVVSMLALTFPALTFVGVGVPAELQGERLGQWVAQTALRIGVIVVAALVSSRLVAAIMTRAQREMASGAGPIDGERHKRAETIGRTFKVFLSSIIWAAALLMILRVLDVDITPVLTGAGILGLAVGFGAQTLVKDVIAGIFVILEDQVRVGDVAMVNGIGGSVEQINLRTLVLRDLDGTVHIIPNGEIRTLANQTKDFSYYVINLGIDYADDVDAAMAVVTETAEALRQDPAFAAHILAPVEMFGVDDFGASAVTLQFRIKTLPLSQWLVGRELRRRLKKAFDQHQLRIPMQQVEVTLRKGS
jgi:small conductance mechanosensitive channel